MRVRSSLLLAVTLGVLATALAGCGGGASDNGVAAKSPDQIVAAAKAAADGASSVHVSGSGVDNGKKVELDLQLVAGRGGTGHISQNGLSFDLIRIGDTAYIKGGDAFYRSFAGPAAVALFRGKWLKGSAASGDLASLAPLTDLRKLLDSTLSSHGQLVKGDRTTVAGRKVIAVVDKAQGGTLYVATTGTPFAIEVAKSGAGGRLVFDHWNGHVSLSAPSPSDVVDVAKLTKGH